MVTWGQTEIITTIIMALLKTTVGTMAIILGTTMAGETLGTTVSIILGTTTGGEILGTMVSIILGTMAGA